MKRTLKYFIKRLQFEQSKYYGVVYTNLLQTGTTRSTANMLPVHKFKFETMCSHWRCYGGIRDIERKKILFCSYEILFNNINNNNNLPLIWLRQTVQPYSCYTTYNSRLYKLIFRFVQNINSYKRNNISYERNNIFSFNVPYGPPY